MGVSGGPSGPSSSLLGRPGEQGWRERSRGQRSEWAWAGFVLVGMDGQLRGGPTAAGGDGASLTVGPSPPSASPSGTATSASTITTTTTTTTTTTQDVRTQERKCCGGGGTTTTSVYLCVWVHACVCLCICMYVDHACIRIVCVRHTGVLVLAQQQGTLVAPLSRLLHRRRGDPEEDSTNC